MKRILRKINRIREKYHTRMDGDDGEWRTTDDGHKIHLNESGAVDLGNQFSLAVMGKPDGVEIPKKSIKIYVQKPFKEDYETRADLAKALQSRKDKDVVFGGFYKVEESGGSLRTAAFFNPYTGACFNATVDDTDNDQVYYDALNTEFREMRINDDVAWLWRRCNGVIQKGDKVRVFKGRTIPHGTEAKVRAIYPFKDRYGRKVADYAYLDNGQKININNIEIVED